MNKIAVVFALVWFLTPSVSRGENKPLWELGAGMSALYLPDYRGSDQTSGHLVPIPYLVYRGKRLRADRTSVKGQIFKSDRVQLDISLGGGLSVNSDENEARSGMPDLDYTVEIGPSIEFCLWKSLAQSGALWLKVPLRGVFSTDGSDLPFQGWKSAPYFQYQWKNEQSPHWWKASLSLGPIFSSERYHDYFYEVEPAYVTGKRPEYHPKGGYAGSRMTLTIQKKFKDFWVGGFMRYDDLSGAVFETSPLVKTDKYFAAGLAVAWVPFESKTLVNREP